MADAEPPLALADRLGFAAYGVAAHLAAALALPLLPVLALTRHGVGLGERLGGVPGAARGLRRPLWLHAASVGEVLASEPLLQELRRRRPEIPIVVSTTTVTGRETARERLCADAVTLLPLDVGWIVARTLQALHPRCLVIVETEIWPALLYAAARSHVPRLIVSGRISTRSAGRYARLRWLLRPALSQVNAFAMQSEGDAKRIVALGAPPERVHVIGSLKWARQTEPGSQHEAAMIPASRTLLVAASTHAGEERIVLDACARLWRQHPDLLLLLAPRRPQRFDEVERLVRDSGLRCERRSQLRGRPGERVQVLLLDTLGELPTLLPAARAVFVGGTLVPVGGHNVSEPALFAKPVAFGPHTENVAAAADALLQHAAATRVHDAAELHREWRRFLEQPAIAARMGASGRAVVANQTAVAERTFDLLQPYLDGGREWVEAAEKIGVPSPQEPPNALGAHHGRGTRSA